MKTYFIPILLACAFFAALFPLQAQQSIYVAPTGNDRNAGTKDAPLASLPAAIKTIETSTEQNITLFLQKGTYHLEKPLTFSPEILAGKRLQITTSTQSDSVIISGNKRLSLQWKKGKHGLWEAQTEDSFDQLWINGSPRILARYPNYRKDTLFNGTAEDALSPERIKKWKNPEGGYIHSMHAGMWGSQHYLITGKVKDSLIYEGGYQVSRPSKIHPSLRYVENIREELDSPGEWFLDKKKHILYYYPLPGETMDAVEAEATVTPHLFVIRGTENEPVRGISINGITFTHTRRTVMEPYEMLMRSDWGIYRGAAVLFENTENCKINNCEFKEIGGNAVFLSRYAYQDTVIGNHIHHTGGSAICIVGDTSATRSGAYGYSHFIPFEQMDRTPGPKNKLYPRQCLVEDNLIHDLGTVEKQVAGVEIQIAAMLTIRYNTIYDVPRAGINVGDGAFGGHLIEYNDVFDTVLETSDHGAFNSWGRDRFWHPKYNEMARLAEEHPELIEADALYTNILRYNRFRCDHGWDIDLDDGSSNYHIYNNICLRGGIKLREGFLRKVENNILVNNSLHPHVWFKNSHDVVRRNLFMQPYYPISLNGWGEQLDYNFFTSQMALDNVRKNQTDAHSITGAFDFEDAARGNYTLLPGSKVFEIGFENIPMDRFGVYSQRLKALAKTPEFPLIQIIDAYDQDKTYSWLGATIRIVNGLGDRSAFGLPDERGIVIIAVEKGSLADKAGLGRNDVIRAIAGKEISTIEEVFALTEENRWKGKFFVTIIRNQTEEKTQLKFK